MSLLLAACALPVAAESEAAPVSQQVVLQPDRELQDTSELLLAVTVIEQRLNAAGIIARVDLGFDAFTQLHLVSFSIRADQHDAFGEFTESNVGRRLAIVLDGVVLTAPVLQGRITGEGQITGLETLEEATRLASLLHGGALPFALKLVPNAP